MSQVIKLFVNRRGWVALIPGIVMISQLFGVDVTEEMLNSVADKILVGVTGVLALWSLYRPKSE